MKSPGGSSNMTNLQIILKYLGMVMSVLYVIAGVVIIWKSQEFFNIPDNYALPAGSMLIVYGMFRAYRIYTKHFQQ